MEKREDLLGRNPFRKLFYWVVLCVTTGLLTGCITFLTEIKLNGDGSGTMIQTMTMNPEQVKASMEGAAKEMGMTAADSKEEPQKKDSAAKKDGPDPGEFRNKAADLGEDVTFVLAEKIDTKTAAGVRVTYAFKDINKLSLNPKPSAALGTEGAGASAKETIKFRFSRGADGNAVLTIVMPPPDPSKTAEAPPPAEKPQVEPDPQMKEMLMQMFKGLRMGVSVEVDGKITKTNSPYVEGSKVTLMDIDFDPLLADAELMKTLNTKLEAAMGDDRKTIEALKGVRGLKVTTDPQVTVEFTPQKRK